MSFSQSGEGSNGRSGGANKRLAPAEDSAAAGVPKRSAVEWLNAMRRLREQFQAEAAKKAEATSPNPEHFVHTNSRSRVTGRNADENQGAGAALSAEHFLHTARKPKSMEVNYEAEEKKQAAAKTLTNYSSFVMTCIGEDVSPSQLRLHLMKEASGMPTSLHSAKGAAADKGQTSNQAPGAN